jgi:hypothetical protein
VTDDQQDHYAVLGLPIDATPEEIREAYRRLARQWHPDANPQDQANAEAWFKLIGQAYDVLSTPSKRHDYDTRPLRLLFRPAAIDFGDLRPDDLPKVEGVQLLNAGRPPRPDEAIDALPEHGPFWAVLYDELCEASDPHAPGEPQPLCGFLFESTFESDPEPGTYRETVRCGINGSFAELEIRANVIVEAESAASTGPGGWDHDHLASSSSSTALVTATPKVRRPKLGGMLAAAVALALVICGVVYWANRGPGPTHTLIGTASDIQLQSNHGVDVAGPSGGEPGTNGDYDLSENTYMSANLTANGLLAPLESDAPATFAGCAETIRNHINTQKLQATVNLNTMQPGEVLCTFPSREWKYKDTLGLLRVLSVQATPAASSRVAFSLTVWWWNDGPH